MDRVKHRRTILQLIADRVILSPSTHAVDTKKNHREVISSAHGIEIEAFVSTVGVAGGEPDPAKKLIALKIPGTGGRAERSTGHPCEAMVADTFPKSRFTSAEIWTLNHRGYGRSTGPASLDHFVLTLELFWAHVQRLYPSETKLVTGNSLGCISALYLAARKNVSGLLIRNPPPLARMIAERPRYNAWNFGLARMIAAQVPSELDSIANAKLAQCPALMVTSEKDRVVPVKYQEMIKESYAGDIAQFVIPAAAHHHRIPENLEIDYQVAIQSLTEKIQVGNS